MMKHLIHFGQRKLASFQPIIFKNQRHHYNASDRGGTMKSLSVGDFQNTP